MKMMNEKTLKGCTLLLAACSLGLVGLASAQTAAVRHVASAAPAAARPGCIQLTAIAEVEKQIVDENGQKVTRLVPAAGVIPGNQVIYTVKAANVCEVPAANVLIDNPIPEHTAYVADSAIGAGAAISYSLDGKRFAQPDALTVRDANDKDRPARADEYTQIRWVFHNPIGAGQVAIARFRAVVR